MLEISVAETLTPILAFICIYFFNYKIRRFQKEHGKYLKILKNQHSRLNFTIVN